MDKQKVSLVKCASYDAAQVQAAVKSAVDLLGGIEKFIKPGEKVLLKPNLLTDAEPERGITTHPEVVRAVIRLIKPITKDILCGDSPSVWGQKKDIERVYEITGIKKVCQEEDVSCVYFTQAVMKKGYPLAEWAFRCDRFINIPKFKTHGFTVLTAGLKNLFGLITGMYKMKVHRDHPKPVDLARAIVDIYEIKRPDLTIADGIIAMEGQGPGSAGTLKKMDLISASADALCLDMVLATIMNVRPQDIPTNKEAIRRGLGPLDLRSIEICGDDVKDFVSPDFKLPKTSVLAKMPKWAAGLLTSFLTIRPFVRSEKCKLCGVCQRACPVSAIQQEKGRLVFDRKRCILCLCCQEICPQGAIDIQKSLLLRILER